MRRRKRQDTRQQQQHATNVDDTKFPRHATNSCTPSGNTSPLATSSIDQTSFFGGGGGSHNHQTDYAVMSAITSNLSLPIDPLGAGMIYSRDTTARSDRQGEERTVPRTSATVWDDQDLVWQQHSFLGGSVELQNVSLGTKPNIGEIEVQNLPMVSDNNISSRSSCQSGGGERLHIAGTSDGGDCRVGPAATVEYSVTCQRGKLKTLVNHLMDAAISEIAGRTAEDDEMTITLRLKV